MPRQLFAVILERIGWLAMQPRCIHPVKQRRWEDRAAFGENDGQYMAFGRETTPELTLRRGRPASGQPVKPDSCWENQRANWNCASSWLTWGKVVARSVAECERRARGHTMVCP